MGKPTKQGPVNNLPDCLSIDLSTENRQPSRREKNQPTIVLKVTVHFHEQTIITRLGNIAIGVTGGDLRLQLEGVKFLQHSEYAKFQRKVGGLSSYGQVATQKSGRERSSKPAVSAEAGTTGGKLTMTLAEEDKVTSAEEATAQRTQEFTYDDYQLHALGGVRPGWRFRKKGGESYLQGSFVEEEFGTCMLQGPRARIEACFEVEQRFVRMDVISGPLLSKGVYPLRNPIKRKIANFLIWKKVVEPNFTPWLSHVVLSYE